MNNITRKIQKFILSEQFVVIFTILYILIIGIILIEELRQSSFRASNQVILLLLVSCIPVLLIPTWIRIAGKIESIKINEIEINLKKEITNKVTTELIENVTASTDSTVYSLASFMILQSNTVSDSIRNIRNTRDDREQIIVGCQNYTEQRILCAIITELLRKKRPDLNIIPKYNLGGVGLNFIALARGDIDIYPAYTWQGFEMVYGTYLSEKRKSLIDEEEPGSDEAKQRINDLNELYKSLSIPLRWICYTGFHDNWNIVVRKDYANKNNIEKISDLKDFQSLSLACEYDFFARPNGYRLLTNSDGYGLKFGKTSLIDHRHAYETLENKDVDVIDGFTTDPQIKYKDKDNKFKVLQDDRHQFGRYYSSILVRKKLLDADNQDNNIVDNPKLEKILQLLEEKITSDKMTEMIKIVDQYHNTRPQITADRQIQFIEETANKFLKEEKVLTIEKPEGETT